MNQKEFFNLSIECYLPNFPSIMRQRSSKLTSRTIWRSIHDYLHLKPVRQQTTLCVNTAKIIVKRQVVFEIFWKTWSPSPQLRKSRGPFAQCPVLPGVSLKYLFLWFYFQ